MEGKAVHRQSASGRARVESQGGGARALGLAVQSTRRAVCEAWHPVSIGRRPVFFHQTKPSLSTCVASSPALPGGRVSAAPGVRPSVRRGRGGHARGFGQSGFGPRPHPRTGGPTRPGGGTPQALLEGGGGGRGAAVQSRALAPPPQKPRLLRSSWGLSWGRRCRGLASYSCGPRGRARLSPQDVAAGLGGVRLSRLFGRSR
mmetsp:Transcript_40600/g.91249  ORF Transcript_40600/g.91249 Transcript_40600/m.91249 type:complete len:202 (-) Transcript_40600:86-691(-)